jgi:hypothetical protein
VLMGQAATDPVSQARNAAFLQGLQELGWMIGRNVAIEYRWAPGDVDNSRRNAEELVALAPDVILATGGVNMGPLRAISRREALFAMPEGKMDPCGRRGAAKNPYSITLLAWASNIDGNSMPRALAVFRLTARSNFTGACTGRSAGFAPLRIRST